MAKVQFEVMTGSSQDSAISEYLKDLPDGVLRASVIYTDHLRKIFEIEYFDVNVLKEITQILTGEPLMTQFKKMKMRINNPDHSKAVQKWLFEQGYFWASSGEEYNGADLGMIFTSTWEQGRIGFAKNDRDGTNYYQKHEGEEINVQHLDPHLYSVHTSQHVPAKSFRENPQQNTFDNMLKNLKHLDKAIESHDNKQNKRQLDRKRILDKLEAMLPEGYGICMTGGVVESELSESTPEEIVVGSVWECIREDRKDVHRDCSKGGHYKIDSCREDYVDFTDNVGDEVTMRKTSFLKHFKRIS